jgi:hypothetical protein
MANTILHRSDISAYGTAVYPSATRTASPDTVELEVGDSDGFTLVVDVTGQAGSGAITVKVEGVDRVSGKTFPLTDGTATATTASLAANGTTTITVGPSIVSKATAPISVNTVVPQVIRVTSTQTGTSCTYSVGFLLS